MDHGGGGNRRIHGARIRTSGRRRLCDRGSRRRALVEDIVQRQRAAHGACGGGQSRVGRQIRIAGDLGGDGGAGVVHSRRGVDSERPGQSQVQAIAQGGRAGSARALQLGGHQPAEDRVLGGVVGQAERGLGGVRVAGHGLAIGAELQPIDAVAADAQALGDGAGPVVLAQDQRRLRRRLGERRAVGEAGRGADDGVDAADIAQRQ